MKVRFGHGERSRRRSISPFVRWTWCCSSQGTPLPKQQPTKHVTCSLASERLRCSLGSMTSQKRRPSRCRGPHLLPDCRRSKVTREPHCLDKADGSIFTRPHPSTPKRDACATPRSGRGIATFPDRASSKVREKRPPSDSARPSRRDAPERPPCRRRHLRLRSLRGENGSG